MALDPWKATRYAAVGLEFTSPILAGAIIGHYLDAHFKTDPWLTLLLFLLGVFAGFYRLVSLMREYNRER